jgi:DNA-binding MarR family transcriptional regulator
LTQKLGGVLDFMRLVWAIDHGLQSHSKRMNAELGITGMQRFVVRIVGRFPGISPGELARILHVHPSTLTGVLKRLQQRRVLQRKADAHDGRRSVLRLTPKGESYDALREGTIEAQVSETLAQLPPNELSAARTVLTALAKQLTPADEATLDE